MLPIEPVNLTFAIPAQDHLGREGVVGKVRFLPDHVELSWRLEGNVFRGGKGELTQIDLPYGEIEHVDLVKKWFRYRSLVLRIGNPALVAEIPGVDMGKLVLKIDERSREEAKKLSSLIDFKRSVFLLDEQEKRLASLKEGDELG